MNKPSSELALPQQAGIALAEASAVIAPLTAGGVIESAAGAATSSMDGIVQAHLTDVAIRTARGDNKPERPAYVYNPASRLLIKFSLHRDGPNPNYHGLFADVVELNAEGAPRHGISNPDIEAAFDPSEGFIPVTVAENKKGFTPSSIPIKFEETNDTESEAEISFPNIELATLHGLMKAKPMDAGTSLKAFMKATDKRQEKAAEGVRQRSSKNYMGTFQALSSSTNPNLHLIITDKQDTSEVDRVSRELGMYPIFLNIDDAEYAIERYEGMTDAPPMTTFGQFFSGDIEGGETIKAILDDHTPAFVTVDLRPFGWAEDSDGVIAKKVTSVLGHLGVGQWGQGNNHKPMRSSSAFRNITNCEYVFQPASPGKARKGAHGLYLTGIEHGNEESMKAYTDLLRKAKLDFALTQYLRGVDNL